jgi:hypothetical protein
LARGVYMAGGQRIDDYSFMGSDGRKFPEGVKKKEFTSAVGAGAVMDYEDTTEKIKAQQDANISKAKAQKMKPSYRN